MELQAAIDHWQRSNPNAKFLFRPYGKSEPQDATSASDESDEEEGIFAKSDGVYCGCGGIDEDQALKAGSSTKQLLFIHQEEWQRDLLRKFGEYSMIDATYRTTMYDIALFFIVVPTNVGYTVVATFCVQSEGAADISEGLEV